MFGVAPKPSIQDFIQTALKSAYTLTRHGVKGMQQHVYSFGGASMHGQIGENSRGLVQWLLGRVGIKHPVFLVDEAGFDELVKANLINPADYERAMGPNSTALGAFYKPSRPNQPVIILLKAGASVDKKGTRQVDSPTDWYFTLGHELGHMIHRMYWDTLPKSTQTSLQKAYRDSTGATDNLGFNEWFADQTALYARKTIESSDPAISGSIPLVFHKLIGILKELYGKITSLLKTRIKRAGGSNATFEEFMREISARAQERQHHIFEYKTRFQAGRGRMLAAGIDTLTAEQLATARQRAVAHVEQLLAASGSSLITLADQHPLWHMQVHPDVTLRQQLLDIAKIARELDFSPVQLEQRLVETANSLAIPRTKGSEMASDETRHYDSNLVKGEFAGFFEEVPGASAKRIEDFWAVVRVMYPRIAKVHKIYAKIFSTADTRLRQFPAGGAVADFFMRVPGTTVGTKTPYHHRVRTVYGMWFSGRIDPILRDTSAEERMRLLQELAMDGPEQTPKAIALREAFNEYLTWHRNEQIKIREMAGVTDPNILWADTSILSSSITNYVPHKWKPAVLQTEQGAADFRELMDTYERPVNNPGMNDQQWESYYQAVYDRLIHEEGTLTSTTIQPNFKWRSQMERGLTAIPTQAMMDKGLIVTDLEEMMHSYFYGAARQLEWERSFGEYVETIIEGNLSGAGEVRWNPSSVLDAWVNDLRHVDPLLAEEARNILAVYEGRSTFSVNPKVRLGMDLVLSFVNTLILPFALFANFSELGGVMARADRGPVDAMKGMKAAFKDIRANGDGYRLARSLGVIMDRKVQHAMFEVGETAVADVVDSRIKSKMMTWNENFFKYNGMEMWTKTTRLVAMEFGIEYLDKHAQLALNGKEGSYMRLQEVGITGEEVQEWIRQEMPLNPYSALSIRMSNALQQFVDGSVMRPNPMMRPVWMSDPMFQLLSHLKGFFYYFHNTFTRRSARYMQNMHVAGEDVPMLHWAAWSTMVPLAIVGMAFRDALFYAGSDREAPDRDWQFYMERTGALGPATVISEFFGTMDRYGPIKGAINTSSPTLGLLSSFVTQKPTTAFSKMVPPISWIQAGREALRPDGAVPDSDLINIRT